MRTRCGILWDFEAFCWQHFLPLIAQDRGQMKVETLKRQNGGWNVANSLRSNLHQLHQGSFFIKCGGNWSDELNLCHQKCFLKFECQGNSPSGGDELPKGTIQYSPGVTSAESFLLYTSSQTLSNFNTKSPNRLSLLELLVKHIASYSHLNPGLFWEQWHFLREIIYRWFKIKGAALQPQTVITVMKVVAEHEALAVWAESLQFLFLFYSGTVCCYIDWNASNHN